MYFQLGISSLKTINQMKTALGINIEYVVQNMETMFQQVNINVMGGCV
jgi:hypothetical protein